MYDEARKEKLQEIKRLMREIMSEDGEDSELSSKDLDDTLEEASEVAEENMEESSMDKLAMEDDSEDEEEEFLKKRKAYFQPKSREQESRPSKVVFASNDPEELRLSKAIPSFKSSKRMKA